MNAGVPLAWLQLRQEKKRVAAASAGILFAVVLMLVQLGFQDALLASAGVHIASLNADLILASPQYQYLLQAGGFPERRIYQASADSRVESIAPLYIAGLPWKNPVTRQQRMILVIGAPPRHGVFALPSIDRNIDQLKNPEQALYDSKGRTDFGPVPETLRAGHSLVTEISNRQVEVVGLFEIGTSFGVDGTVVVSDLAFFRLAPFLDRGSATLGLVKLKPGADAGQAREELQRQLGPDVRVYTRDGFILHEQNYWTTNTPVGFIFKLGVMMGLFVGLIIVYQILYTDVMDHLEEYATLKAIGFTDRYLYGVVLQEGLILSVLGFLPGALLSVLIYKVTAEATFLPLGMTAKRMLVVYGLTAGMCLGAAALAMRPVRALDPAEIL